MENRWSFAGQVRRAFCWESKNLFYKLRYFACVVFGILLAARLLPQEAVGLFTGRFIYVTVFVNVCLALILFTGLLYLPEIFLASSYTQQLQLMEKTGDISVKAYLLARLALCVIMTAMLLLTIGFASSLMERFSTDTVRWFQVDLELGFWKQIIAGALVQPLLFLWYFLSRLSMRKERRYVRAYFYSGALYQVFNSAAGLKFLHFAPGQEPPVWVLDGVWYLVMLVFAAVVFWQVAGWVRIAFE